MVLPGHGLPESAFHEASGGYEKLTIKGAAVLSLKDVIWNALGLIADEQQRFVGLFHVPAFRASRFVGDKGDQFPAAGSEDSSLDEVETWELIAVAQDGGPNLMVDLPVVRAGDDDCRPLGHTEPPQREELMTLADLPLPLGAATAPRTRSHWSAYQHRISCCHG